MNCYLVEEKEPLRLLMDIVHFRYLPTQGGQLIIDGFSMDNAIK
ncbi:MAG TPA: hypothetical protein VFY68_01350 [Nitrososphaeraceae archaeon]|nr:hypothetical protein [Nitrososphaeraceae archaeon]